MEGKVNESETIERVINWTIQDVGQFDEGSRNNFIFTLATKCHKANLNQTFTERELINRYQAQDFPAREIRTAVKSAFKANGQARRRKPTQSTTAPGKIATRLLNEAEQAYWQQYGVSPRILEIYNILGVDSYQAGGHSEQTEKDNPIFAYHAGGDSYKIYRPFAVEDQSKFFWIGSKPDNWYFGLEYCKGSERVYIAAGEKDTLTLVCQGVDAFTLNSETAALPDDLAGRLKKQFREVVILYDNDTTGQDNSKKLCDAHSFTRAILPDGIKDISDLIKSGRSIDEIKYIEPVNNEFFVCRPVNAWIQEAASTEPLPQLFGPFVTKAELTILFADPSAGKSVLALQLADDLCRGERTLNQANQSEPKTVIIFDFELSPKQFERRNSDDNGNLYQFHPNLFRAEINGLAAVDDDNLEDVIYSKIEALTIQKQADIIIIDNISWLHSETDKAKFAVPLMRKLKGLVKSQGLTVVVINHTVKRDESKPITANDMAGSKQLRALADMIFTIGRSAYDKNTRYLKMLKDNRTTGEMYGPDNCLVCELVKTDRLHLRYLNEAPEAEFLKRHEANEPTEKDNHRATAQVLKAAGHSNVEIGKLLGVTEGTIRQWLK